MATNYATLNVQYKFIYQIVFPLRLEKQDEDNQMLDETELYITLKTNQNLTESDFGNIDIECPLENQK